MMTELIKGVDISNIQGHVDFKALAASGVQFVICRCGVGNNGVDNLYKQNIANATAAGLKVAAYHFIFPLPTTKSQPTRDPKVQAKMHFDAAGNVPVVCCDLEWPEQQDWSKWGCTAQQITEWTVAYLEEYESLSGTRPVVYTYPNFAKSLNLPESFAQKYKLWIASYQNGSPWVPKPWTDWVLWQDSGGTQNLPNGGPVDTDKAKDLSLWDPQPVTTATTESASVVPIQVERPAPVETPVPIEVPAPVVVAPEPVAVAPPAVPATPKFYVLIWQLITGLIAKFTKRQ